MSKRSLPTTRPRTATSAPRGGGTAAAVRRAAPGQAGATRGSRAVSERRRADVAVALLLAIPAIIIPGGFDRFVFGKLLVAAIGVGLAFSVRPAGSLGREVRLLLGGAAAILVVSAALSAAPWSSFLGRGPRNEGLFVLATYLLAGIAGARLLGPQRRERTHQVAIVTMAACVIAVAALAALETAGLRPLSSTLDRPGSLLGNASDEGAMAVLYAGPLLVEAVRTRRAWPIAGTVAAVVTVALSASRGALLGLAVALLVIAIVSGRRARIAAGSMVVAAAVIAFALPFTRDRLLGSTPLAGQTVSGRVLLWQETLRLLARHPVFGVGPSQYENAIVSQHTQQWQRTVGPVNPPGSPHDIVLQIVSAGGLLLLAVAVWLAVVLVRRARGGGVSAHGPLAGLAGYTAALMFHLTSPGTAIPAAVLAGGLIATAPAAQASRERWLRRGVPVVAAALAVVFLLAAAAEIPLRLGSVAANRGALATADSDYRLAGALRFWDPDLPVIAMDEFAGLVSQGHKAALPYAREWLDRSGTVGNDEQVAQNRAAILFATGDNAAARRVLDAQLARDRYNPQLLLLRGVVRAQQQDYQGARADLELSARIDPANRKVWQDLEVVYRALGEEAQADDARARASRLSGGA